MLTYNPRYDEFKLNGTVVFDNRDAVMKQMMRLFWGNITVTVDDLIDACYADDSEGGPMYAVEVIRSRIMWLKRKLLGSGWTVESIRYNVYSMVRVDDAAKRHRSEEMKKAA